MAGPPMPIDEFLVAITTSQQPSSAALPAKQRPELMPTSGATPLSRPKIWKAMVLRPATDCTSMSPGRPPPPSVKTTSGMRCFSTISKIRSFL